jgi:hypothetical protein
VETTPMMTVTAKSTKTVHARQAKLVLVVRVLESASLVHKNVLVVVGPMSAKVA